MSSFVCLLGLTCCVSLVTALASRLERDPPKSMEEPCQAGPVTDAIQNSVCGGMHFLYKIPWHQQLRGLFVLIHGCQKAAIDWFEMPEESAMTDAVLRQGFAVAAVDSPPRPGNCWDWENDSDGEQLAKAIPLVQRQLGLASLPFFGIGVSSGGMMLAKIVHSFGVRFSGIYFNVAPTSPEFFAGHEKWPPSSFLFEPFDSWAAPKVVQEAANLLRSRGTKVQVLKAGPKPLSRLVARSKKLGFKPQVVQRIVNFFRANGFTNVPPDVLDASKFLGRNQKEYLFANSADIAMKRLAESPLAYQLDDKDRSLLEELHVLNGMHTASSEHFEKALNFLLGPSPAATQRPSPPPESPTLASAPFGNIVNRQVAQSSCSAPLNALYSGKFDYVCDMTVPWFHSDGSNWAPATPPLGTGCHRYVFLSGIKPACAVGQSCNACRSPPGQPVFEVRLLGGSCEAC